MQRRPLSLGKERQVDRGGLGQRELDLGLGGRLAHALQGGRVAPHVDAGLAPEEVGKMVRQALVEVVAAQVVVARGGQDLHHAVADLDDRDVEGAAAQVVDHHLLGGPVLEAVGERRGGGLVDDAQHVEPRDAAGVLGGLALHVVEVGGHGDHRVGHLAAQVGLGVGAQLAQDHGRDLLRGVGAPVDVSAPVGAHVALDRGEGAVGVGDRLALGDRAHQALASRPERHDARRGAPSLGVGDDGRPAVLNHGDAAVGGSQIDSDSRSHGASFPVVAAGL